LVLTSRRGLPPREAWPDYHSRGSGDRTARQIALVRELEAAGAEVRIAAADAADETAMRRVVDETLARFGRIDGVVHAAGVAGGGMIQLKERETAAEVLKPKVTGTRVLARVLENREPDFLLLCSSLTSVIGGIGQVDYCGANAYLDAFARQYAARSGRRAIAVNWTTWREVGMAVETTIPEGLRAAVPDQALAAGLSNAEGVDAFRRILGHRTDCQIAMSSRDLIHLMEENRAMRVAPNGDRSRASSADRATGTHHPRPNLQSAFVAPRTSVEERI
jgi:NAD(P)-dependent dehydrogenase (short-subunit alcohol dehydrogenase family)